jgi:hypothetical protein
LKTKNLLFLINERREKMKRSLIVLLLVGLMAISAYASTRAVQTGNWNDPNTWETAPNMPPLDDEVKLSGADDITVTVNDNRDTYDAKLAIARGNILDMTAGSLTFNDDVKVGDAGASGDGTDVGTFNISGGTFTAGDRIVVGYKSTGEGYMTISGGTVNVTGGGGFKVGCESGDGSYGYLKIEGDGGALNVTDRFHIANDSTESSGDIGHGVVEFELNASGDVSRIVCEYVTIDSQDEEDALAELVVSVTGTVNAADIVLFESTSGSSTVGEFDTLNGGSAAEGAYVQLGSEWFQLTYEADVNGDSQNNDIVLINVPEPMTIMLLGLGGLLIRRKK